MSPRWHRDRLALIAALLAPPAVAAVLIPFRTGFATADAALVLVAVVVAVAANGQRTAGVLAALSASVWFDFFLTRPYERFAISSRNDIQTTVLLLVVGVAVTELAVRGRRLSRIVLSGNAHLTGLRSTASAVASGLGTGAVIDQVNVQLTELLGLRGCRFERNEPAGHPPRLGDDGTLTWAGSRWDVDSLGLPSDEIELLARCQGRVYGRFMLLPTPATAPSVEARRVAVLLADLAGAALVASPAENPQNPQSPQSPQSPQNVVPAA